MTVYIKNMVCNRCISAVEKVFNDLQVPVAAVHLGEVETTENLNKTEIQNLDQQLQKIGFQILEDASKKIIEKVKKVLIVKINELDISEDFVLSKFLAEKLLKDYSAISKTFSQNENVTLEQFFILQKIEKVKELLLYDEFSLTEISNKLGYKSVQHLSSQFKNTTGFTPSAFKTLKVKNRLPLDSI
ncbi:AraC family transcriptional regulator [Kaistella solincola]|uniref:AraC family transcriptional regulator n=1 Tax=Kaistella solincola TaxID=510955 RepID=A0ABR4ZRM7_9FLAO|nr:helix-turn-helix domain-containing protein [Kaistella solincola]KIA83409.1 AraC family transcriptional regulator [Kaistella solincola]